MRLERYVWMATSYRPYAPGQVMLLPAALQDWLPKGHLAYFINDTVDALDLSAFYARYGGGGARNQPFHPAMMVKVLVYGYATGVFSSRKIEWRLEAIAAARQRLEQQLREADSERGRSHDDDRRPRHGDGNPKGGRYPHTATMAMKFRPRRSCRVSPPQGDRRSALNGWIKNVLGFRQSAGGGSRRSQPPSGPSCVCPGAEPARRTRRAAQAAA